MTRINVEVDEKTHHKAKSILALKGSTLSEWIRKQLNELINEQK